MKKILLFIIILGLSITGFCREWTPLILSDKLPFRVSSPGNSYILSMDSTDRGMGIVFIPEGYQPNPKGIDILIHFNSSSWLVNQEFLKTGKKSVIVTLSYPGIVSAYSTPFSKKTGLFTDILQQSVGIITTNIPGITPRINRLSISSFGAGYGAVREILNQPAYYQKIQELVLIDSLQTELTDTTTRVIDTTYLDPFLKFAKDASQEKKLFITTHCAFIPNGFMGSAETNQYLVKKLKGKPKMVIINPDDVINTSGRIGWLMIKGNFTFGDIQGLNRIHKWHNFMPSSTGIGQLNRGNP